MTKSLHLVTIERTAVELVVLKVSASSQEAAEARIEALLDQPHRVGIDELVKVRGIALHREDFAGDDESSWEVSC